MVCGIRGFVVVVVVVVVVVLKGFRKQLSSFQNPGWLFFIKIYKG